MQRKMTFGQLDEDSELNQMVQEDSSPALGNRTRKRKPSYRGGSNRAAPHNPPGQQDQKLPEIRPFGALASLHLPEEDDLMSTLSVKQMFNEMDLRSQASVVAPMQPDSSPALLCPSPSPVEEEEELFLQTTERFDPQTQILQIEQNSSREHLYTSPILDTFDRPRS